MARLGGWFLVVLNLLLACVLGSRLRLSEEAGYIGEQTNLSEEKVVAAVDQAFDSTEEELECLYGGPRTRPWRERERGDAIPNIVHFMVLGNDVERKEGAGEFDFLAYLAVRSALVSLKPEGVYLHVLMTRSQDSKSEHGLLGNPWVRRLKDNITIIHHPREEIDAKSESAAREADILRLEILREKGGIYLDLDVIVLRPFTNMLYSPHPRDVVLGFAGGNRLGFGNGVIAARRNSSLINRWLLASSSSSSSSSSIAELSREPNLQGIIFSDSLASASLSHPQEFCALPPDAFFWPTWTKQHIEWMHKPLGPKEAEFWRREMGKKGGSLFDNQIAYRAWRGVAGEYVRDLDEEGIRSGKATRFTLLVGKFLEDDDR